MSKCQRFYQIGSLRLASIASGAGQTIYSGSALPVTMRALPTITPNFTTQTNCVGSVSVPDAASINLIVTSSAAGQAIALGTYTATADL
jgi:hypothetical protein